MKRNDVSSVGRATGEIWYVMGSIPIHHLLFLFFKEGVFQMRDSRILMTKGNGTKTDETDKQYTAMSNGRGVTEAMKQEWNRKPYYMTKKEKQK